MSDISSPMLGDKSAKKNNKLYGTNENWNKGKKLDALTPGIATGKNNLIHKRRMSQSPHKNTPTSAILSAKLTNAQALGGNQVRKNNFLRSSLNEGGKAQMNSK